MKKIARALFFVFVVISCKNYAVVEEQKSALVIKDVKERLEKVEEIEWVVGYPRNKTISKGITLKLTLPEMQDEDIKKLSAKYQIDSWIIKLRRLTDMRSETLGYIYLPFQMGSWGRSSTVDVVYLQVVYSASFMSTRFKSFNCPALGHRKKIEAMDVVFANLPSTNMVVSYGQVINDKVEFQKLAPVEFNGGESLTGRYLAEFALFSSESKNTFSEFVVADGEALVGHEEEIELKDCKNIREEDTPPLRDEDKKRFKFGQ